MLSFQYQYVNILKIIMECLNSRTRNMFLLWPGSSSVHRPFESANATRSHRHASGLAYQINTRIAVVVTMTYHTMKDTISASASLPYRISTMSAIKAPASTCWINCVYRPFRSWWASWVRLTDDDQCIPRRQGLYMGLEWRAWLHRHLVCNPQRYRSCSF